MKNFFVALAVLGFIASCTVAESIRRAEDPNTILAQLDSTPFGSTVLSLVSVHLSTNGPLDQLVVLLNSVVTQLKNDGVADKENNETNEGNCVNNIKTFQGQIKTFKRQLAENRKIKKFNVDALNVALKDLKDTLAALALNQQRLREGQAERDQQHQTYTKALLDRENGIKVLDGAIQLAQHLQAGSSFAQLKKRFDSVQNELVETSKQSSFGHLYTPLITALSELAEKASPETTARILKLFNDLRSDFAKDKQTLTNAENKQQESWISLRADLETEQDALLEKRKALEENIASLRAIIKRTRSAIKSLKGSLAISKKNLKSTRTTCAAQSAAYVKRVILRKAQSGIIRRVITFFASRAKATTDFIRKRTEGKAL